MKRKKLSWNKGLKKYGKNYYFKNIYGHLVSYKEPRQYGVTLEDSKIYSAKKRRKKK